MNKKLVSIAALAVAMGFAIAGNSADAQAPLDFVTPGANTNIIGVTPDPANIRDHGLKQQQEPSCIVRPSNEAFIFCAYNDLRAADLPLVQGDSWMGVSMSNDAGQTWFSRLAPGFLDHPNSLGMGFAADPGVVAIPGNSPGLAILNYIAAFRDSDNGVLAIQRWVEYPQEDQDFWKAEDEIYIVADGSEGRFIDKPAFYYLVDDVQQQGVINEQIVVEGVTTPVDVTTPTGTLIVVYAVFTGNGGGAKLLLRKSYDNGKNWTKSLKISEEQNEVTGVSVTAVGQDFVVVYRRKGDTNEPDAILSALCSNDGNQRCSKGEEVFQICPFDQPASGSTFRTFSFPWAANDGKRFWAFAADRRYPDNSCQPVPLSPGLFGGKPRIVGMSSLDGKTWVGADGTEAVPFQIAARDDGFQLMPVAFGTKGRIDIAWYDTFREELFDLPPGANDILINDYLSSDGSARVFRKADVYMTRLTASSSCGNNANAGCTPDLEAPVRVSQYQIAVDLDNPTIGAEIEGHLPNLTLYASGTLAFNGDYISLATPGSRKITGGKWIPNSLPAGGNELPGYVDSQDLFVAWGDNRDVRADIPALDAGSQLPDLGAGGQMPYTPPLNSDSANPGGPMSALDDENQDEPVYERPGELVAEDQPDDDPVLPSDVGVCEASFDFSRSRNSNVYSSLVRDEPSLIAPTPTKPLGTIQRMFPLVLTNIDLVNPKDFCLQIENQPLDYPPDLVTEGNGLASFFQLPSKAPFSRGDEVDFLDVNVFAGSSASRAVFVTTNEAGSVVTVNAYEGACPEPRTNPFNGPLISSVQLSDGDLFDPVFCQNNPNDPVCLPVNDVGSVPGTETHDISFAAPVLQSPVLQSPTFQSPTFQSPVLQSPTFQSPTFQSPVLQSPTFQSPTFQSPTFQSPTFQSPVLQSPTLQSPTLQSNTFGDTATNNPEQIVYQDITYPVNATANVTTTYSADIALNGLNPDEIEVQLIAWTPNTYATAVDCYAQPIADQQIIAYSQLSAESLQSVTLPTTFSANNQNPYAGAISFFGQPNKDIAVIVRIWAVGETPGSAKQTLLALQASRTACLAAGGGEECDDLGVRSLISFGASAHSCRTGDAVINTENPNSDDCLNNGNEKILEDKQGPAISIQIDSSLEATGPTGTVVNYTATATDNNDPNPTLDCAPPTGTTFGLGIGSITCEALDNASPTNQTIETLLFTVVDTTAPTLPILADITEEATSSSGASVSWTLPTATDIVDPNPSVVCSPDIGSPFGFGPPTPVTCTATDFEGQTVDSGFTVTVKDTKAPVITPSTVPGNIVVNANVSTGWQHSFPLTLLWSPAVSATDDVDGTFNATCSHSETGFFPLGETTVTCSATDTHLNESYEEEFSVTVEDQSSPSMSLPSDVTVLARDLSDDEVTYVFNPVTASVTVEANLPDPDGARITYTISASDIVVANPVVTCLPASGSTFAVGVTTVSCTASDGVNTSDDPLLFSITVQDTTDPVFDIDTSIPFVFEANVEGGAYVDLVNDRGLVATDRGTEINPTCTATPQGGGSAIDLPTVLPPGDYDVTCSVPGATSTTIISIVVIVDVNDEVPPVLNIPAAELQVDADATTGTAIVDFLEFEGFGGMTITATDIVDTDVTITCDPASGTEFGVLPIVGQGHLITCTASDDGPNSLGTANTTSLSFTLVVNDRAAPTPPLLPDGPEGPTGPNVIVEATGATGAVVDYNLPSVVDAVDIFPLVSCMPAPGELFAIGNTDVTCTATDFSGNLSSGGLVVAVRDTTAATFGVLANTNAEATSASGAMVNWDPIYATDIVDGQVLASCAPASGTEFAFGPTTVTCTAIDTATNSSTAQFVVTVADTTAPSVTAADINIDVVTAEVDIEVDYITDNVVVSDTVDANPALNCSVTNPGPNVDDDGTTASITSYGTWEVSCTATDASSNFSAPTVFSINVSFPHGIDLILPKGQTKAGSTIPIDWQYLDSSRDPIDSGFIIPTVNWIGPFALTDSECSGDTDNSGSGNDSGSSGKRYSASSKTWQFSWQTPNDAKRYKVVISPPGADFEEAWACVRLK